MHVVHQIPWSEILEGWWKGIEVTASETEETRGGNDAFGRDEDCATRDAAVGRWELGLKSELKAEVGFAGGAVKTEVGRRARLKAWV